MSVIDVLITNENELNKEAVYNNKQASIALFKKTTHIAFNILKDEIVACGEQLNVNKQVDIDSFTNEAPELFINYVDHVFNAVVTYFSRCIGDRHKLAKIVSLYEEVDSLVVQMLPITVKLYFIKTAYPAITKKISIDALPAIFHLKRLVSMTSELTGLKETLDFKTKYETLPLEYTRLIRLYYSKDKHKDTKSFRKNKRETLSCLVPHVLLIDKAWIDDFYKDVMLSKFDHHELDMRLSQLVKGNFQPLCKRDSEYIIEQGHRVIFLPKTKAERDHYLFRLEQENKIKNNLLNEKYA